jgi:hypothetical protein
LGCAAIAASYTARCAFAAARPASVSAPASAARGGANAKRRALLLISAQNHTPSRTQLSNGNASVPAPSSKE